MAWKGGEGTLCFSGISHAEGLFHNLKCPLLGRGIYYYYITITIVELLWTSISLSGIFSLAIWEFMKFKRTVDSTKRKGEKKNNRKKSARTQEKSSGWVILKEKTNQYNSHIDFVGSWVKFYSSVDNFMLVLKDSY